MNRANDTMKGPSDGDSRPLAEIHVTAGDTRMGLKVLPGGQVLTSYGPPALPLLGPAERESQLEATPVSPIDEARRIARAIENGRSKESVAVDLGVSVDYVRERVSLLGLAGSIQELLETGRLPHKYGLVLARLKDPGQQLEVAAWALGAEGGKKLTDVITGSFHRPLEDLRARVTAELENAGDDPGLFADADSPTEPPLAAGPGRSVGRSPAELLGRARQVRQQLADAIAAERVDLLDALGVIVELACLGSARGGPLPTDLVAGLEALTFWLDEGEPAATHQLAARGFLAATDALAEQGRAADGPAATGELLEVLSGLLQALALRWGVQLDNAEAAREGGAENGKG